MKKNKEKRVNPRHASTNDKQKQNNGQQERKRLTSGQLQKAILDLFGKNPRQDLNPRQVLKRLGIANNRDSVQHALEELVADKKLLALEDFKFKLLRKPTEGKPKRVYEGYVDITRTGSAYIVCDDQENDVYVSSRNLGTALHGDRVEVAVWRPRHRQRPEGEVIKVLERASDKIVGAIHLRHNLALVVPMRQDIPFDVHVELNQTLDAGEGERVVVKVTDWGGPNKPVHGVVTDVLGFEGNDLEMNTILINSGFDLAHPDVVMRESEAFPEQISEVEISTRRDFRRVTTFTIDPADAKDFDDALSVEFMPNGQVEVGVHIADVTHFLAPGSEMDKEAFKRSTSVYLVDRVIPMLPERLSNNLCSLRPNEDRLTFSAVFTFDRNKKVVGQWFGKTVIHSDQRFNYEEAQELIEAGKGRFFKELNYLNTVARQYRKQRFEKGAIDFNVEEVRFRLDEKGVPVEAYIKDRKEVHMLIEEFMLLANRRVATYIHQKGKGRAIPFVFRVHDVPNIDKVAELARFAKELGFNMKISSPKEIANSYNRLIIEAEKNPALDLLAPLAIRTMAKAEYSTYNIGHYGLAFEFYTHFTSPIRRYADVLVHRILEANLGQEDFRTGKEELEERCKHISLQERKAMDAERQSIKYKQVEFMEKHIGEEFNGLISGIIERGFFVELEGNKCEGMVPFETLNEPFEVPEGRLSATGLRSGRRLTMGDRIRVKIVNTDLQKRQIDMRLVAVG